ncbi:MAG TPA: hypothetical protein VFB67_00015 [Candidatus Polarisedimenticolaceae bacterium]|nr:hypothetical protein [Candidatus Polarisedimenticolaceae bacterium]
MTRLITAVAIAATLAACGREAATPKEGAASAARRAVPGIVLVTVEGWSDPKAPADPFTASSLPGSVRLDDAMTPCPQIRPAVVAMLTGANPDRSGVRDDLSLPLPSDAAFLPEALSKQGWQTAAFVANPQVGVGSGLERGFDIFDAPREPPFGPFRYLPSVRPAAEVLKNFGSWATSLSPDRPFFAWVQLTGGGPVGEIKGQAPGLAAAWTDLSARLASDAGLKDVSVLVVGVSGAIDVSDGLRSGYFLQPSVLRIPFLYRSRKGAEPQPGERALAASADVAAVVARDASIDFTAADGRVPWASGGETRVRFGWTWRGAREFGWPVQAAAVIGSTLYVRERDGDPDRMLAWGAPKAADAPAVDGAALMRALERRPAWAEPRQSPAPAIPVAMQASLRASKVAIPTAAKLPPAIPIALRAAEIPGLMKARSIATQGQPEAAGAFDGARNGDPGNIGARVEAGQILALIGRAKKAREQLEPALHLDPYRAATWHWLGHVSFLENDHAKAETMWRLSELLDPHDADVLYDLACVRSLAGDPATSAQYLRRAWEGGFRNPEKIQSDPDLRNLRESPRFAAFMSEVVR